MAKKRRQRALRDRLEALDSNETQKLYKQARRMRRAARGRHRGGRGAEPFEDGPRLEKMRSGRERSLDDYVEQLLGAHEVDRTGPNEPPTDRDAPAREGQVIHVAAGRCEVEEAGRSTWCPIPASFSAGPESVVIGDRVLYRLDEEGSGVLGAVLPRRTHLSRRDPAVPRRAKVVAANIDRVVIVGAVVDPPLRPRLIDRYLVAIERGGAEPIIAVNKCDLAGDAPPADVLEPYRRIGIPVVLSSARTGAGVEELRRAIAGRTVAFVGHSGVGKSSLIRALDPSFELETAEVGARSGKGRHTTTASTLYRLDPGIRVIDTPGIREFGLVEIDRDELRECFPEFAGTVGRCKFGDCSHDHEPRCAVREAVEAGEIPRERWETYRRLLGEL